MLWPGPNWPGYRVFCSQLPVNIKQSTVCRYSAVIDSPANEIVTIVDRNNRVWGRAYACVDDGNAIVLQEEEVQWGAFLPIDEVIAMSKKKPFTPDGLLLLEMISKQLN